MAKGKSLDTLYINLGLNLSELQTDFIQADKTVNENLAKLNRENNLIKLRMQVETAGLDPAKDAAKILEIQTKGLNEQLRIQQDRLKIATANWRQTAQVQGQASTAAQRAEQVMLREKLALQSVEHELQKLNRTQQSNNNSQISNLAQMYASAKGSLSGSIGQITAAMGQLQMATVSTDAAITESINVISKLKNPYVAAAAAIAALPVVLHALENEIVNLAKPAIEAGDAIYTLSRRMATTTKEAGAFNTVCKAMGVDTNTVLTSLERMSRQWLTAGANGNATTKALKAFGVELTDSNGRLKSHHERMLELAKGFERAKAAGQQMELQNILIKNGMGDMVVAIEDYASVSEDVNQRLVKNGLANPELAHKLQGEINLLNIQTGQLKSAFSAALMPVAEEILPHLTETFANLTKVILENKDTIKLLGQTAEFVLSGMTQTLENSLTVISTIVDKIKEVRSLGTGEDLSVVNDESIQSLEGYVNYKTNNNPGSMEVAKAQYRMQWEQILAARKDAAEEAKTEIEKQNEELRQEEAKSSAPLLQTDEALQSIANTKKNLAEIEKIQYEATHTALENEIYDIEQWKLAQLEAAQTAEEKASIVELAEAKIQAAQRKSNEESAKRTKQYLDEAQRLSSEASMSAYEKELAKIDEWQDAMKQKATTAEEVAAIEIDAAARAARAYEDESKRVQDATKSFQDEIYKLTHSQYENAMKDIMDKYNEGLKKGVDKSLLDDWLRVKTAEINQNAKTQKGYNQRKFEYSPSYNVPNYAGQVHDMLGIPNSQQQQWYREYSGSMGHIIEFSNNLANATDKLLQTRESNGSMGHIIEVLNHVDNSLQNLGESNNQPININVNIDNAVTADNESMTWLADHVADKIAPVVEQAVGGGSNGY